MARKIERLRCNSGLLRRVDMDDLYSTLYRRGESSETRRREHPAPQREHPAPQREHPAPQREYVTPRDPRPPEELPKVKKYPVHEPETEKEHVLVGSPR